MRRTQDEICADLIRRAELLEASAGNMSLKYTAPQRVALQVAARVLRVAAEQNGLAEPTLASVNRRAARTNAFALAKHLAPHPAYRYWRPPQPGFDGNGLD